MLRSSKGMRTESITLPQKRKPPTPTSHEPDLTKEWSDDHLLCHCTNTSKGTILSHMAKCHRDPDRIADKTGASTKCGTCRAYLEELCAISPQPLPAKKVKKCLFIIALIIACISLALLLRGIA